MTNQYIKLSNDLNQVFAQYNSKISNFDVYYTNLSKNDTLYLLINFTVNNKYYHCEAKLDLKLEYMQLISKITKYIHQFYLTIKEK